MYLAHDVCCIDRHGGASMEKERRGAGGSTVCGWPEEGEGNMGRIEVRAEEGWLSLSNFLHHGGEEQRGEHALHVSTVKGDCHWGRVVSLGFSGTLDSLF